MASAALSSIPKPSPSASLALPKRLLDFFAKYPPETYSALATGVTIPLTRAEAKRTAVERAAATVSAAEAPTDAPTPTPAPASSTDTASIPAASQPTPATPAQPALSTRATRPPANPFLPFRNPTTGRWAGARVGLRRQAELVKLARAHDIEDLLPPSRKSTAFKQARLLQRGVRVKGTGEQEGESVKGHKWERQLESNLQKRREAMEGMQELIREWKSRGHGRGWKKYPR